MYLFSDLIIFGVTLTFDLIFYLVPTPASFYTHQIQIPHPKISGLGPTDELLQSSYSSYLPGWPPITLALISVNMMTDVKFSPLSFLTTYM